MDSLLWIISFVFFLFFGVVVGGIYIYIISADKFFSWTVLALASFAYFRGNNNTSKQNRIFFPRRYWNYIVMDTDPICGLRFVESYLVKK